MGSAAGSPAIRFSDHQRTRKKAKVEALVRDASLARWECVREISCGGRSGLV